MIAMYMLNEGKWKAWYNCGKHAQKTLGYSYPTDA